MLIITNIFRFTGHTSMPLAFAEAAAFAAAAAEVRRIDSRFARWPRRAIFAAT